MDSTAEPNNNENKPLTLLQRALITGVFIPVPGMSKVVQKRIALCTEEEKEYKRYYWKHTNKNYYARVPPEKRALQILQSSAQQAFVKQSAYQRDYYIKNKEKIKARILANYRSKIDRSGKRGRPRLYPIPESAFAESANAENIDSNLETDNNNIE